MTPAGRPPVGPRVELRLTADLLDQVDTFALAHECSRAEAVRMLLDCGLAVGREGPQPCACGEYHDD